MPNRTPSDVIGQHIFDQFAYAERIKAYFEGPEVRRCLSNILN